MTTNSALSNNPHQVLYRHVKCPQWGLAVQAWASVDKRAFQFEDGNLRVFKDGFFSLLEEVDPPADKSRRVLQHLNRSLGRTQAVQRSASKDVVLIPFEDQLAYFKTLYPEGFTGQAWLEKIRGEGVKRALKRHRAPALAQAKEQLGADVLDRLLAAQDHEGVILALITVLKQTDLTTASKLKPLNEAPPYQRRAIAAAARDLIHGEEALPVRFTTWVNCMSKPSWELATALLALVHPAEYISVKPSIFEAQALWLSPRLRPSRTPQIDTYQHYLKMAQGIFQKLEQAEIPPRDMMDVYDFIEVTLRPNARKLLAKNASKRIVSDEASGQEAA